MTVQQWAYIHAQLHEDHFYILISYILLSALMAGLIAGLIGYLLSGIARKGRR